jgi:O-antigen ligase
VATPTTTAAPISPSVLVERLPASVRVAALALIFLGVEAVLAAAIVQDRFARLLLLFVAAGGLALVFRFPMATTIAVLGLTDFIFHAEFFPSFGVGPVSARGYELALAALLVVAAVRPKRHGWGGVAGLALAVFLVCVAVSGLVAAQAGRAELTDVFNWSRALGLLTIFYVVVRLFPEPHQRRTLLTGAVALTAATGVVALLLALGWGPADFLKDAGDEIVKEQEGVAGINRIRLPGLAVGYALFWYAAVRLVSSRGWARAGWTAALAGIALEVLVSFNRNMWSGLVIGLFLLMVLGGPFVRSRMVIALAVALGGVALVTAVSPAGEERLIDPVVKRGSTILNPQEVSREGSYKDRQRETEAAWETAKDNVVLGVGAGAPFGVWYEERIGENSEVRIPQLFLHNQYLYLLLIAGLPGVLAFLVFLGAPVALALRRRPRDLPITTCAIGIASIMISSVVAIYFTASDTTVVLGMLAGVIVADADGPAADALDSGLA